MSDIKAVVDEQLGRVADVELREALRTLCRECYKAGHVQGELRASNDAHKRMGDFLCELSDVHEGDPAKLGVIGEVRAFNMEIVQ